MLKIRLRRVGAKNQPSYRVVVADARSPRDGRFVETIGHYNPRTDPPTVVIRPERAIYWLGQGAQPTKTAKRLLERTGILDMFQQVKAGASLEEVLAAAKEAEAKRLAEEAAAAEEVEEEAAPVPPEELPIAELGLSPRVVKALEEAELATAGDLLNLLAKGDAELLAVPGFGGKALEEVKEALRQRGLIEG
ncbi:MAG TPA: 30S ribosomal protein S16 [Anaerolineae bacterium]|nr:30S ribosomal protein S16 [Anaerolineae bacterium]